jgi:hypothetical protein
MLTAAVEVSESLQRGLDDLLGFLPRLVGFLLILLIGYLVAKALQKVVSLALEKVGTDRALASGAAGSYVERVTPEASPSKLIGRVVFWFVLLGALSIAITSLGINALNDFLAEVFGYLPNVVAAILIFVVASALAGWLGRVMSRLLGATPTGKLAATALPVLVMAIAVFMILNQLQIATDIVTITYAALMGAVALGMALAFGLGGRDVASRMLETRTGAARRNAAVVARRRTPGDVKLSPQDKSARPASEALTRREARLGASSVAPRALALMACPSTSTPAIASGTSTARSPSTRSSASGRHAGCRSATRRSTSSWGCPARTPCSS